MFPSTLLCCALLLGTGSPPAEVPALDQKSSTERLRAIEKAIVRELFQRRPWLAIERGNTYEWFGLGRFGPAGVRRWTAFLDGADGRLAAINRNELSTGDRLDYEWAVAWVHSEAILSLSRAPERWDPAMYVDRALFTLRVLAETDRTNVIVRGNLALAVTDELPQLWESARRSLITPCVPFIDLAQGRLHDLEHYLTEDMGELLEIPDLSERARRTFGRRVQLGAGFASAFRTWLDEVPTQGATPIATMGADSWQNTARALTGTELSAAAIKTKLLREMAMIDRRLGDARIPEPAQDNELDPDFVAVTVRMVNRDAVQVVGESGLFDSSDKPPARFASEVRTGLSVPGEPAALKPAARGIYRIEFEVPAESWSAEEARTRMLLLAPGNQRAQAIRYGFPGEALLRTYATFSKSPTQRFAWNRASFEGWGLFALDWLSRIDWVENPFETDEDWHAAVRRLRLLEVARLITAIELHAEGLPMEDAVEAFQARTEFDLATSRREVVAALRDPMRGIGYLAWLQLVDLEKTLRRRGNDRQEALRQLLGMLVAHPSSRPTDLRKHLLPEEAR